MNPTKKCLYCGKLYEKSPLWSVKVFKNRKYCGAECYKYSMIKRFDCRDRIEITDEVFYGFIERFLTACGRG